MIAPRQSRSALRRAWDAWTRVVHVAAVPFSVFWMSVVYLLVLPFFLFVRLGDPLGLRRNTSGALWREYPGEKRTLDNYRRMF